MKNKNAAVEADKNGHYSKETSNVPNPWRKNYDYGEGLFSGKFKYKSVEDFLKAQRKKKKTLAEEINDFYLMVNG